MRIAPRRLPQLLGVLVIAFAQFEAWPLLGAVALFRGLSIQLVYRWVTGQVLADPSNRSVLLWSNVDSSAGCIRLWRKVSGALAATAVGFANLCVSAAILVLPLATLLTALGVEDEVAIGIPWAIVGVGWVITCSRAIRSYRSEVTLMSQLPPPSAPRWQIDHLAAIPARSGHGGRLLAAFLAQADSCRAEVVLHCDSRNVAFYRKYGFHPAGTGIPGGQRVMLRKTRGALAPHRRSGPPVRRSR